MVSVITGASSPPLWPLSATWYQDMEEGGAGGKVPGGSAVEAAVMTSTPSLSAAGEYWC